MIAGLVCDNGEIFSHEGKSNMVFGGKRISFQNFPLAVIQKIDNSITPTQNQALDEMGIKSLVDRRHKWTLCNQASLDFIADFDPKKQNLTREVVECNLRGVCQQEGKLCLTHAQASGLTFRELEVLTLIGLGYLNKEIADQLNISINTVPVFTKHLRDKTGCFRKADLALYARKLNLI